jgi:2-isopropylmalate synthase
VRILTRGTDAVTRVLVESTDRADGAGAEWTTVGVHGNVVEASWLALVDALACAAVRRRTPAIAAP